MEVLDFISLTLVAIPIGLIASLIGIGGGIFMVPLLVMFYSASIPTTQVAVGTSLAAIIFTSLSSTLGYARQKVVDFRLGLPLMPSSLAGVLLGAYLTEFISSQHLALIFGAILVYVSVLMLWGKAPLDLARALTRKSVGDDMKFRLFSIVVVGFLAGLASGFFGIGGGIIMVPALSMVLGIDILVAIATSLFVMGPMALIGSMEHTILGHVRYSHAIALALGIIIGAQLGTITSAFVPKALLRRIFGVVLLWSAYNMLSKGITLSL
jgi:hypothetical protein